MTSFPANRNTLNHSENSLVGIVDQQMISYIIEVNVDFSVLLSGKIINHKCNLLIMIMRPTTNYSGCQNKVIFSFYYFIYKIAKSGSLFCSFVEVEVSSCITLGECTH